MCCIRFHERVLVRQVPEWSGLLRRMRNLPRSHDDQDPGMKCAAEMMEKLRGARHVVVLSGAGASQICMAAGAVPADAPG